MALRTPLLALLTGALVSTGVLAAPTAHADPTPACTVAWDGGGGTAEWRPASNWTDDRLPGAADTVCVSAATGPATLRVTGGDVVVAGLRAETTVEVSLDAGAGLALAQPSTARSLVLTRGAVVVVATDDDGAATTRTARVEVTAAPTPPTTGEPTTQPTAGPGRLHVAVREQRQHLGSAGRPKVRLVARVRSDQAAPLRVRGKVQLRVHGRSAVVRLRPRVVQLVPDRTKRLVLRLRRPAAVLVAGVLEAWRDSRGRGVRAQLVFRVTWADGSRVTERRTVRLR